jgi:acyl-CoA dehydrogenase
MIKFFVAGVLQRVLDRAIQTHGAYGLTDDSPLSHWYRHERAARIYDGPDEVHKVTVARQVLKRYRSADVPSEHVPTRARAAREKFADLLAEATADD